MHYRSLDYRDLLIYGESLFNAFLDNHLILDEQNELQFNNTPDFVRFLSKYIIAKDSILFGLFDSNDCRGYVIFDNIRMAENGSSTQVHIAISKKMRGKKALSLLKLMRDTSFIDIFYAEIPSIAIHAINLCRRLGFKKTGYIPNNIPYKNLNGQIKLYDTYVMALERDYRNELSETLEEINNINKQGSK